jgi:peptidoglycan hydrolase-like protein with peptidoglycan-binding domain
VTTGNDGSDITDRIVVTYTNGADASIDNLPSPLTAGTYTIHYNVVDADGTHAAEVTRTVNVAPTGEDDSEGILTTPPVITLIGPAVVNLNAGDSYFDVFARAKTSDWFGTTTCSEVNSWCNGADMDKSGLVDMSDYTNQLNNGTVDITREYGVSDCSADNSWCNGADFNRSGIVDMADYVITFNSFNASTTGAFASDGAGNDLTSRIVVTGTPSNLLTAGTYIIHYNVTDAFSHSAPEVIRTINVAGTEPGKIAGPTLVVRSTGGGGGGSGGCAFGYNFQTKKCNPTAPIAGQVLGAATSFASSTGQVLGASTFKFTDYLRKGMSGNAVKELQERLRAEGYFTFRTSTGYFGPITFEAVRAYQKAHDIPATGFVGPLTTAELNK